jgi:hypothetical protein
VNVRKPNTPVLAPIPRRRNSPRFIVYTLLIARYIRHPIVVLEIVMLKPLRGVDSHEEKAELDVLVFRRVEEYAALVVAVLVSSIFSIMSIEFINICIF